MKRHVAIELGFAYFAFQILTLLVYHLFIPAIATHLDRLMGAEVVALLVIVPVVLWNEVRVHRPA